jgi:hypothetical protein
VFWLSEDCDEHILPVLSPTAPWVSFRRGDTNTWRMVKLLSCTTITQLVLADPAGQRSIDEQCKYGCNEGDVFTSDFRSLVSLVGHRNQVDCLLDYTATGVVQILERRGFFTHDDWRAHAHMKDVRERRALISRHVNDLVPKWRSNNFGMLHLCTMANENDEDKIDRPSAMYGQCGWRPN